MSILINGMALPTDCRYCVFQEYSQQSGMTYCSINGPALATDRKAIQFEGRAKFCPLIEIPPHGPLIDMDDFLQECSELESYRAAMELCEVIEAEPCNDLAKPNNAPTIIPADGGE